MRLGQDGHEQAPVRKPLEEPQGDLGPPARPDHERIGEGFEGGRPVPDDLVVVVEGGVRPVPGLDLA